MKIHKINSLFHLFIMNEKYPISIKIELCNDKKTIKYNDLNFKLNQEINLDEENPYLLAIDLDFSNIIISEEEVIIDEISSLLNKIEKYQKGKMSSKEIGKMIKKCEKFPSINIIKEAFSEERPLDEQELNILKLASKDSFLKINKPTILKFSNIKIENEEILLDEVSESSLNEIIQKELDFLIETTDFQNFLQLIFDNRNEEKIREQINIIKNISGKKESSNKKNKIKVNIVDEYLKEKQKLIEENANSNYFVDIEFPLPQANNLERILELGEEIFQRGESKINLEVLENDLDKRDVHYYTRALGYLGLAKYDHRTRDLCLTYNGDLFFKSSSEDRKDIIFNILNTDDLVKKFLNNELDLNNSEDKKLFELRGLSSDSTIMRRLSSLKSWINYLAN